MKKEEQIKIKNKMEKKIKNIFISSIVILIFVLFNNIRSCNRLNKINNNEKDIQTSIYKIFDSENKPDAILIKLLDGVKKENEELKKENKILKDSINNINENNIYKDLKNEIKNSSFTILNEIKKNKNE